MIENITLLPKCEYKSILLTEAIIGIVASFSKITNTYVVSTLYSTGGIIRITHRVGITRYPVI